MAFAVSALIMLMLLYLNSLKINSPATAAWALAFACICARHFCLLLIPFGSSLIAAGADFFLIGFVGSLWLGACRFNGEHISQSKLMLWLSCSSMWVLVLYLTKLEVIWRMWSVQILTGGRSILLGVFGAEIGHKKFLLIRYSREQFFSRVVTWFVFLFCTKIYIFRRCFFCLTLYLIRR